MEREEFTRHLSTAVTRAVEVARSRVTNVLPDEVRCWVRPNQSYDGNPLVRDERRFPEDSASGKCEPVPLVEREVVAVLWREGSVPEWVNVHVAFADERHTIVNLHCCGRYTATQELLYHVEEGYPPFHVLSPELPPEWMDGNRAKFDLMWRRKLGRG